ncbi:MAG: DMT family transporter [Rubrivivax sp.]|nr:DMT family transporter [Rubrivivax sp.]
MRQRDVAELVLLAALWGASFLFMRVGAPEFGPVPLVFVRLLVAGLVLLPLLAWAGQGAALRQHWRAIAVVGLLNSAFPFVFFSIAALALGAALMSVFNATAPIWGALVAWVWLGEKPTRWRATGLVVGIAGVVGLAWGKSDFRAGEHGVSPALGIALCVAATLLYGVAANFSRKKLAGVAPMAQATGSQLSGAVLLALPAWVSWPAAAPGPAAWGAALGLAVACSALAYVLYFRLIAHVGAPNAMSVTFLIPAFAMLWGWLLLGEAPTPTMLAGCAVILLGTALATGLLVPRWPRVERA